MAEFSSEVQKLLVAVVELGEIGRSPWVSWHQIAKSLHGSDAFRDQVAAIADLPDVAHLFAKTQNVVKLSDAGWTAYRLLQGSNRVQESLPEQIARAVVEYAASLAPLRFRVDSVGKGVRVGNRFVQPVTVEAEETFATDTPVTFRSSTGWTSRGKVVGQEPDGFVVYLTVESEIFADCLPGYLEIDRAFLLHALATRLAGLNALSTLATAFLQPAGSVQMALLGQNNSVAVADDLAQLPVPWSRFLWGPPGAGKTYGLGRLIRRLLTGCPGEQHLIVAPSNRAVDVALLQFLKHCQGEKYLEDLIKQRRILRFGYARLPEILSQPELLGPANTKTLTDAARELSQRIRDAERAHETEEKIAAARAELLSVLEELRNTVHTHFRDAAVVFTTSTLAYLGSERNPIADIEWASVLVDEVTMVPPAQCALLASLARQRFLLAGDPRQLGPVYESNSGSKNTLEWMAQDVFEKSGISTGQGETRTINLFDSRLARIDSQRRCCKTIWDRVKRFYPRVNSTVNETNLQLISQLPPKPGDAVVLLDTSVLSARGFARCEKAHGSWRNVATAELAMEVACAAIGNASGSLSVAIITPYRAQVRLLRNWIRQETRSGNPAYQQIEAGTVHQFQGSDADFVIFDVVDGIGRPTLGTLLRDDTGLRLTTVAITRAKGKVVIIADRKWFQASAKREYNPLLWDLIAGSGINHVFVDPPAPDGLRGTNPESPIERALREAMSEHAILNDVEQEFRIYDQAGTVITRADFAFPELKYAVYCDGAEWHLKHDRWQKDLRQRNMLTELGWRFSAFPGKAILDNPNECAAHVVRIVEGLKLRNGKES